MGASPMRVSYDERVGLRDGATLAANVFLPVADGRHPVVMAMTTYGKDLPFSQGYPDAWARTVAAAPEVRTSSSTSHISFESVDPERWTSWGYAVVLVDARGTGRSPGTVDSHSGQEADDYVDAIEWAAGQEWSNGRVGLLGMSYLGVTQWLVASRRPPHLAAIVPSDAYGDPLREIAYHGGVPCDFYDGWHQSQVASVQHGRGETGYRNAFTGRLVSGDTDIGADARRAAVAGDAYRQSMEHPLDDAEFWDARRARWDEIDVPVLSLGSWGAVGVHLRGNIEGFRRAASRDKWLVLRPTKGGFANLYAAESLALQRAFLDATLRGTGDWHTTQPRVQVRTRGPDNEVAGTRQADTWPLPTTRWETLYLDVGTRALEAHPPRPAQRSYLPGDEGILLTTAAFARPVEITGPLHATLWLSCATTDTDLFLVVHAFDPAGRQVLLPGIGDPRMPLTHGWLRASQRTLDAARSSVHQPRLSHRTVRPLFPGARYRVEIEIWPTSFCFPAGYRLGLTVRGDDYRHGSPDRWSKTGRSVAGSSLWTHADRRYRPHDVYGGRVTLYSGTPTPSSLTLPVQPPD